MMRKLVADSTSPNGSKSASLDRRQSTSQTMGRCSVQAVDSQHSEQVMDRWPAQSTDRQPVLTPNRQCAQTPDRRVAPAMDRRPVASSASNRRPALMQGSKKGTTASATVRPENGNAEPRQQILVSQTGRQDVQPKLALKGASKPATTDKNRTRHFDSHCQDSTKHKRARSSSMEFDDRSAWNSMQLKGRARSPDEDDSFIDDDDDVGNVSSLIHKLMGYNPNKYRGNDDFDDRSMEVGFRTIQAEERRSAREARLEDERELALIEAEEREERLRKAKKKLKQTGR